MEDRQNRDFATQPGSSDKNKSDFDLQNNQLLHEITQGEEGVKEAKRVIKLFHNAQGELLTSIKFVHVSNSSRTPIVEMSNTEVYIWDKTFDIKKRLEERIER